MSKVQKCDNGCWIWTASVHRKNGGYGQIQLGRRGEGVAKAHRVSYELHCGPIPDELMVLHRCDNRRCVNPEHLFLGTAQDNTDDMIQKKRAYWQAKKEEAEAQ